MKSFLVKQEGDKLLYSRALMLQNPSSLKIIDHPIRIKILKILSEESLYPAELAKRLMIHEQKVYYHIKQLLNANVIEIKEKKEVRGTTAKKYVTREMNFALSLGGQWKKIGSLVGEKINKKLERFINPFIVNSELNAGIIVGSPDPHGPFKARARDSHYAIDLALFIGQYVEMPDDFSVKLDVGIDIKTTRDHLILVGGPVTNLVVSEINESLPIKFSDKKPFGLVSNKAKYSDDSIGIIARIQNPYVEDKWLLVLAGIRYTGTKAAVIALTRHYRQLLESFNDQRAWARVVHGFDLDGDGRIDSVEILE